MGAFKAKNKVIPPSKPKPEEQEPEVSTAAATEPEAVLIQKNDKAMTKDVGDILDDGYERKDKDQPNAKHADMDFSRHENFMGGKRIIQTDGLSRALNCECYLLDVTKEWGANPLGGRPVPIRFTREFPGKKILYDHFDASPEADTKEKVMRLVNFKMKMANDHGFIYLYQHQWVTLTTTELDRQLKEQRELLKKK